MKTGSDGHMGFLEPGRCVCGRPPTLAGVDCVWQAQGKSAKMSCMGSLRDKLTRPEAVPASNS